MAAHLDEQFRELSTEKDPFMEDKEREALGRCPTVDEVNKLVRHTKKCEQKRNCESAWNCRMHAYILDLAFDNENFIKKLDFVAW